MKLKLTPEGHAVVQDGRPVYVQDDGKEVAFDAPGTVATISRLNGEAKTHRERAEAAESKLKPFEGIADPAAAIKALNVVKNLNDKQLVDAGEVERVKTEAIKAVEEKYAPVVKERESLQQQLHQQLIGGGFARSKLVTDEKHPKRLAIPPDVAEAFFGKHFAVKEGKIVATDANGSQIFSRSRPGEAADFDEALEFLVDAYPRKDHILKGSGASGGGAGGGGQGNGGHADLSNLTPAQRMTEARKRAGEKS